MCHHLSGGTMIAVRLHEPKVLPRSLKSSSKTAVTLFKPPCPPPLSTSLQNKIWFAQQLADPLSFRWVDLDCCEPEPHRSTDWVNDADNRAAVRAGLVSLPPSFIAQYNRSIAPRTWQFTKRVSDLFYLPRRIARPLSDVLIPAFIAARAWSEV